VISWATDRPGTLRGAVAATGKESCMGLRAFFRRLFAPPRRPGAGAARSRRSQREYAVIGLGRFGRSLARRLDLLGLTVAALDIDPRKTRLLADDVSSALTVDSTIEAALREADIESCHTVIVAIGGDNFEASALTTISLAKMGIQNIIALATSPRQEEILLSIGAHRVLNPDEDSGVRLADELADPGQGESWALDPNTQVALVRIPAEMVGHTVADCAKLGVSVLLIYRDSETLLHPAEDVVLVAAVQLLVVGSAGNVRAFRLLE
jgi:trk system potassium uptake protein TrkA